ncbi:MAG: metallophosphoesterase family protein [Oscillospiraceae bacterium]|jgi:predicted MPP superfamily phosphohydrolase|nr:metallophosphoesterase family protein [Oscillospiraceae bacterium]
MKRKRRMTWSIAAAAILAGGSLFTVYETKSLDTTTAVWTSPRVPAAFDGFRIVQLSDLHNARFGKEQNRLTDAVRAARPDLIALTGDFLDLHSANLGFLRELLNGISGLAPVYFINGNHDRETPLYDSMLALFAESGVTVLNDSYVTLTRGGGTMTLAGLDWGNDPDSFAPLDPTRPAALAWEDADILLCHDPMLFPRLAERCASGQEDPGALILCGHMHGGQIALPGGKAVIGPGGLWFPPCAAGRFVQDGVTMIVNRGLGTSGFHFRLFSRPEVGIVVLRQDNPAV